MYKKIKDQVTGADRGDIIQRVSDGAVIPFDSGNADYKLYLAWVAQGNTPLESD